MKSMKDKVDKQLKEKKFKGISASRLKGASQFEIDDRYTHVIVVSDQVEFRLEKVKTLDAESLKVYNGTNVRQYIARKPGGVRDRPSKGLIVPDNKWSEFLQAVINYTEAVFPNMFEREEEKHASIPAPYIPVKKFSYDEARKADIARKSVQDVNWGDVKKLNKK